MDEKKFQRIVELFEETKDNKNQSINIDYLMIKEKNQSFLHAFDNKEGPSDIRSISKTVLTMFLGVVIRLSEKGQYPGISEETYIYPIIKDVVNLKNIENFEKLEKIQIKHLLTHTIGYEDILLMRDDIKDMDPYDYLDYLVNYPIVFEPGEHYLYSNAGFYLLGVVLQEFLQEDLIKVIEAEFFKPLGITDFKWENYGNYIAGATRLWLLPKDLMKFGELLLNEGKIIDQELFTKDWFNKMVKLRIRTEDVDTPDAIFRRYGYGYGTWLAKEPFYFGHGTDGQTLTVLPNKEIIIITLADQSDITPIEKNIDYIITEEL